MLKISSYRLFLLAALFFNNANVFCSSSSQPEQSLFSSIDHYPKNSVSAPSVFPIDGSITLQPYNRHFNSSPNMFSNTSHFLSIAHKKEDFNDFTHASAHTKSSISLPILHHSIPSDTIDNTVHTNSNLMEQSSLPSVHQHPQSLVNTCSLFPSNITPQNNNAYFNSSTDTFIPPFMLAGWDPNNSTNTFNINHASLPIGNESMHFDNAFDNTNNNTPVLIPDDPILNNAMDTSTNTNSHTTPSVLPQVAHPSQGNDHVPTNKATYNCSICSKKIGSKHGLDYHLKTHISNRRKPYQCHICSKRFVTKSVLKTHMKRHDNNNAFKCDYCSKLFKTKLEKIKHHRIHTGEKPYQCTFCEKWFRTKSTLNSHCRIHTGDKPFKCNFCGKGLHSKSALKDHLNGHKKKKPYKCDQCTKAYATKNGLSYHLKTHNKPSPYSCHYCNATFIYKGEYKNHIRYEEEKGGEDRKCHPCKKMYSNKYNLERHNKQVHPEM